jgi:hypothetical protein
MKLTVKDIRFDRTVYIGDGKRPLPPIQVTIDPEKALPTGTHVLEVLLKGPDRKEYSAFATFEVT